MSILDDIFFWKKGHLHGNIKNKVSEDLRQDLIGMDSNF